MLDSVPLWLFACVTVALSFLFLEFGFRRGTNQRKSAIVESEAPLSPIVGSTLGLLAFLLAFLFNIATNRFDERRIVVLNEANAIGTVYLRADFLEEPHQTQVKKLLREYVALRVVDERHVPISQAISRSEDVLNRLWAHTATIGRSNLHSPVYALFIDSVNEMVNIDTERIAFGQYTRVPQPVWVALFALAALSMSAVGYFCGLAGTRSTTATVTLIVSFCVVTALVADLDRPDEGILQTSQEPLILLRDKLGPP